MYKQLSSKVGINLQTLVQRWQFYCVCTKQDQKGLNSTQGQKTRPTRTIWSKRSTMYGRYKKSKNSMHLKSSMRSKCTVAVWTEKTFIPLLTHPQGSQGCQNIRIVFLQLKLSSSCTKIDPKRQKLRKSVKIEKKLSKNLVFYTFSNILQFGVNLSAPNLKWGV
jgi:hypothetical protein